MFQSHREHSLNETGKFQVNCVMQQQQNMHPFQETSTQDVPVGERDSWMRTPTYVTISLGHERPL